MLVFWNVTIWMFLECSGWQYFFSDQKSTNEFIPLVWGPVVWIVLGSSIMKGIGILGVSLATTGPQTTNQFPILAKEFSSRVAAQEMGGKIWSSFTHTENNGPPGWPFFLPSFLDPKLNLYSTNVMSSWVPGYCKYPKKVYFLFSKIHLSWQHLWGWVFQHLWC